MENPTNRDLPTGEETPETNLWEWTQGALRKLAPVHGGNQKFRQLIYFLGGKSLEETRLFKIRQGEFSVDGEELRLTPEDEDHVIREKLATFLKALLAKVQAVPSQPELGPSEADIERELEGGPQGGETGDPWRTRKGETAGETAVRQVKEMRNEVQRTVREAQAEKDRIVQEDTESLRRVQRRPRGLSDQPTNPGFRAIEDPEAGRMGRWLSEIQNRYESQNAEQQLRGIVVDLGNLSTEEEERLTAIMKILGFGLFPSFASRERRKFQKIKPIGDRKDALLQKIKDGERQPANAVESLILILE